MTTARIRNLASAALLTGATVSACSVWLGAPASAQGVPTFDARLFAGRQAIIDQREQDLVLQQDRLTREEELAEIERRQLAALNGIMDAMTLRAGDVAGTVAGLEAGQGEAGGVSMAAASLYAPQDNNPAAARMFGDAREGVEELIIRAARHTHSLPGVSRAGLTLVQWRCLLQALIWQESRFQVGARSPVGAFGLTQIMPGTAGDLGIYPAYYDNPWLQVTGGARYLAQMLNMFDGNIIHALAAYNAGPGRVQQYSGVPPVNAGDKSGHAAAQNQASGGAPSAMARALAR